MESPAHSGLEKACQCGHQWYGLETFILVYSKKEFHSILSFNKYQLRDIAFTSLMHLIVYTYVQR